MAIAMTLKKYLAERGIDYEEVPHGHSASSLETAAEAAIPGDNIAKAVVLKDSGGYLLAALPATHRLDLGALCDTLERDYRLADEEDLADLFANCEIGAVPPAGDAYDLDVVWDDALAQMNDVFFEGGDHETLIHVEGRDFISMMANARHAVFSHHM